MSKPLQLILRRADVRDHVITFDETRGWPAAERDSVFALGMLRAIEDADVVTCTACGDPHLAEIVSDGAEPRLWCPAAGMTPISRERLRRWEIDVAHLAAMLATALELVGTPQAVVPTRIWLLGKRRVGERLAEFFLAHGTTWRDSGEVLQSAGRLQASPAPIILCPNRLPDAAEWHQAGRSLFSLAEFVRLEDSRLVIDSNDFEDFHRQIAQRTEKPPAPTPVAERPALLKRYCTTNKCLVKDVYYWANVVREDLNKWKLGRLHLIPDTSEKAVRIEKLLQRNQKSRV
ncbi:MAG: hypothetical protein ABSG79_04185 [Bryobacteraceae bacterium]